MTGGFFKIVHEKYRAKNSDEQLEMQVRQMQEIVKLYPELKSNIQRSVVRKPFPFISFSFFSFLIVFFYSFGRSY